jgi:hypothetical protein
VRLLYRHHTRVLPSFRRLGLNDALAARAGELGQTELRSAVNVVYVDPNNSAIKAWTRIPAWRSRPIRAFLSCAALAGPAAGRIATAHDCALIADVLNALHDREALYVPYDSSRLTERLSRRPLAYGWSQLLVGSGAVLGVWNAAERATLETPSGRLERRRAFVLDYGFLPGGGLDEFERLIRSSCRRLDAEGITHLSIFCSRGSPAEALIRSLAEQVVDVEFLCGLREPESAGLSGVYVDHLYF